MQPLVPPASDLAPSRPLAGSGVPRAANAPNAARHISRRASLRLLVLLAAAMFLRPTTARADDLYRTAAEQREKYASQLRELAAWCDERGLKEQAEKTRRRLPPNDPDVLRIADLPRAVGRPPLPEGSPPDVVEWDSRFQKLRVQEAAALESLAAKAIRAERTSLAFDLVLTAIREDPDHEGLRRLFGFVKHAGNWYTPYERERIRNGQVWHDRFGWIAKSHVAKYEQGLRPAPGGNWITAEEDAKRRATIESGWIIRTEHYDIQTDHSIEAGVALGVKLERLYRVWRQLFVRYFATEDQVASMFDPRSRLRRPPAQRYKVVFFRNRNEYRRALRSSFPNIDITIGVYEHRTRRAYFFAGDDYNERTLYHEATHQLFHESRPVAPDVGARGNFWIVEGVAMYMETLRHEGEFAVLGGADDIRMVAARYRLLKDRFYVPLMQLCAMSIHDLQNDKRISTLYSQSAGLTHFLIHYDNGRYRDVLVRYLDAIYSGRDSTGTLPQLLGVPFADLDRQYHEFIAASGDAEPKSNVPAKTPPDAKAPAAPKTPPRAQVAPEPAATPRQESPK